MSTAAEEAGPSTPERFVRRAVLTGVAAVLVGLAAVAGYLGWQVHRYERADDAASVHVSGRVVADGVDGTDDIRVRWTDAAGAAHEQRLGVYDTDRYRRGARYPLRYAPAAPDTAYPDDPDGDVHLDDIEGLVGFAVLVAVVLLAHWGLRVAGWGRAARRAARGDGIPMRADALLGTSGLINSTWLRLVAGDGTERYLKVMWHPAVEDVDGTPVVLHGDPSRRRRALVDLPDGTRLWPASRLRRGTPSRWAQTERPGAGEFVPPGATGHIPGSARQWWRRAGLTAGFGTGLGLLLGFGTGGDGVALFSSGVGIAVAALHLWLVNGADPET